MDQREDTLTRYNGRNVEEKKRAEKGKGKSAAGTSEEPPHFHEGRTWRKRLSFVIEVMLERLTRLDGPGASR